MTRGNLRQNVAVHTSMLANVQRVQMKAEGANFAQQRIDEALSQAMPFVRMEAIPQQLQIALEIGGRSISWIACRGLKALLQPMQNVRKKPTVAFLRILLAPENPDSRDCAFILCQPGQ